LLIATIHNFNEQRNGYLIPALKSNFAQQLETREVQLAFLGYQPDLLPLSLMLRLRRWQLQKSLALSRAFTLKYSRLFRYIVHWAISTPLEISGLLKAWVNKGKKSAIEMALTHKHIRAWELFLDSQHEYLLVLEDDAVVHRDTPNELRQTISEVHDHTTAFFLNLTCAFSENELGLSRDLEFETESLKCYKTGSANTAGAYLMHRTLVAQFMQIIYERPATALLNADSMIDKLLLVSETMSVCYQVKVPLIANGSLNGTYITTISD
jgi:hypothetical protein